MYKSNSLILVLKYGDGEHTGTMFVIVVLVHVADLYKQILYTNDGTSYRFHFINNIKPKKKRKKGNELRQARESRRKMAYVNNRILFIVTEKRKRRCVGKFYLEAFMDERRFCSILSF